MSDPFKTKSELNPRFSFPKPPDYKGELLLFSVTADDITDQYKENDRKDAAAADLTVLTGEHAGELFENAKFTQASLVKTLRAAGVGELVLGRLDQVPTNKGNPAWVLKDPSDADKKLALKYINEGEL